jgi:hypothetical protein
MSDPVLHEGLESAESTRPDLVLFVLAVFGGVTLYVLMHGAHFSQLVETVVLLGIMVGYAILVWRIPRIRVRLDQAGDNAYYMGLLFTLTSMAIALHEFSDGGGTEQIVSNFGIALASTICGIFLRVFLHQMRVDPVDVENMTRIELSEATARVRAILGTLSADITLFHREMHQRLNDAGVDFMRMYAETSRLMLESSQRMLAAAATYESGVIQRGTELMKTAETAAQSAGLMLERLKAIEPPPASLSRRLAETEAHLAGLAGPIEALHGALEKTGSGAAGALERMAAISERVLSLDEQDRSQRTRLMQDIAQAATELQTALAKVGTTLQQERSLLVELEADARRASAEAVRAGEAANEVLRTLTEVTRGLTQVLRAEQAGPTTHA